MKHSREFVLWTFFLAVCFWAGYLKGILPLTFKQNLFIKGPVRILNAAPFDLPQSFIKILEEDFGQKIEVQRVKNWDELQAKLVTKNGAHLILAPSFWAQDTSRESLVLRLNPMQSHIEKRLSPDFISFQGKNLTILPLYWTVTDFRVHRSSTLGDSLDAVLQNKALSEVHLYPDADLMATHLKKWSDKASVGGLKLKDVSSFYFNKIPGAISNTALWEVPQLVEIPNTKSVSTSSNKSLLIYGVMIPKNSPNRKTSYRLLERLMDEELEEIALAKLPLGSTLQVSSANFGIKKEQRASELRDLKLHELIILEKREPDLFQEFWQKYNFISPN